MIRAQSRECHLPSWQLEPEASKSNLVCISPDAEMEMTRTSAVKLKLRRVQRTPPYINCPIIYLFSLSKAIQHHGAWRGVLSFKLSRVGPVSRTVVVSPTSAKSSLGLVQLLVSYFIERKKAIKLLRRGRGTTQMDHSFKLETHVSVIMLKNP